jgi:NADH-quinone oxidoreductase subunit A
MNTLFLLAQQAGTPRSAWVPIVVLIIVAIGFAVTNVLASLIIGPGRTGPGKAETYESGMVPIGTARQRFNVRFYIVAMIFLLFDVEIVFFYPWATIFPDSLTQSTLAVGGMHLSTFLLIEMLVFVAILLIAYFYAWGKGVFRWD